ncbi:hypothetical protein [Ancylobacter polymorphus]|uniref:Uncharacterized protein n=1 Tax=Ancylobacter polymorphus TaxID=223390 RepID=A0ABU0B744_9HYPH|nr:hypothetical protein [Ancylobacter polymorphus]MDQ0301414.1 hypothetical protein [Ancylobacter polymorphus]
MSAEILKARIDHAVAQWIEEFGDGPNLAVPADLVLGAAVQSLADLLLAIEDTALRTALARGTHTFLDLCLAAGEPVDFAASATVIPLRAR